MSVSVASGKGPITGDNGVSDQAIRVDAVSAALVTTKEGHHEIHEGNSYTTYDVQNVNATTLKYMVTTPNTTKWAHMLFHIRCTGEVSVLITEGADRTGTNLLPSINRNRNSSNTAGVVVHRAVSGGTTDGAVTIENIREGATGVAAQTVAVGQGRANEEFVLKQNTKYVIAITTYANVYVTLDLDWYEHTDEA